MNRYIVKAKKDNISIGNIYDKQTINQVFLVISLYLGSLCIISYILVAIAVGGIHLDIVLYFTLPIIGLLFFIYLYECLCRETRIDINNGKIFVKDKLRKTNIDFQDLIDIIIEPREVSGKTGGTGRYGRYFSQIDYYIIIAFKKNKKVRWREILYKVENIKPNYGITNILEEYDVNKLLNHFVTNEQIKEEGNGNKYEDYVNIRNIDDEEFLKTIKKDFMYKLKYIEIHKKPLIIGCLIVMLILVMLKLLH